MLCSRGARRLAPVARIVPTYSSEQRPSFRFAQSGRGSHHLEPVARLVPIYSSGRRPFRCASVGDLPAHHLAGVTNPSRFIHRDSDPPFASVGDLPAHRLPGVANTSRFIRRNSNPFASLNPAGVLTISNPSPDLSRFIHRDGDPPM